MADVMLKGVRKSFGDLETLHGIDLDIKEGEFVVFVGPSGCGKSTLLRSIAGLEEISAGELYIKGRLVNEEPPSRRGVAMVFQSYALYPHMTVAENMAFGLKLAGVSKSEQNEAVARAARVLQIEPLLDRKPKALSGGQRQRVAIGRAIVRKPDVFLFDEPLSNLDAALRVQMRIEIAKLHRELGATMIYVTHDQVEAMTLADRIVVLRGGHVEQVGAPLALYHSPANLFVAGFIGSPKMNFLSGYIVSADGAAAIVRLADGSLLQVAVDAASANSGAEVTVGIRPEHILLADVDSQNTVSRDLLAQERLGDQTYLYLSSGDDAEPMTVRADAAAQFTLGSRLAVQLPAEHAHLFDGEGNAFPRLAVMQP